MALEIERRFLVHGDDWRQAVCWQARLQQGYLVSSAEGFTVRVRTASQAGDPQAWITLKTATSADGLVRHEFEYADPRPMRRPCWGWLPTSSASGATACALARWRLGAGCV
jgi:CYTH domain-containing protein